MPISSSQLDFHGRDFRLSHQFTIHGSDALHLPEGAAPFEASKLHAQLIARLDGTLQLDVIESGEHENLFVASPATGTMRKNRPHLRHRLTNQHAGHDRPIGKMAEKEMLIDRNIFDADDLFLAVNLQDSIDQQEWIAVRNMLKNSINVQH